jgi:aerobic carbon-monoxide dehydrogenase medium subunit
MKAAQFDYEKPRDLSTALALLAQGDGDAKILAGGQSLGPVLNFRLAQPRLLVDIRGVAELQAVRDEGDSVFLGACITHAAIEDGNVPDPTNGLLRTVAHGIAYRAVRNRGTLGGSLAHADPAADWVNVMALLDAGIVAASQRGERTVSAATFVTGPLSTVLEPDEIVVGVRIRKLSARARRCYYKFNRKPGEFAEAIGAVLDDPDHGVVRAIVGATSAAPQVIADARGLLGAGSNELTERALHAAGFAPDSYEWQVHAVALRRAVAGMQ